MKNLNKKELQQLKGGTTTVGNQSSEVGLMATNINTISNCVCHSAPNDKNNNSSAGCRCTAAPDLG